MREEYYNFREPKQVRKYRNDSIREKNQDEEEDSD